MKFSYKAWFLSIGTMLLFSCSSTNNVSTPSYVGKEFVTESGLKYTIHRAGTGERAEAGKMVIVHYAGRLEDGTGFDNSYNKGVPFKFELGAGQVIKGWDEGIALLNVGDSATLVIPSQLAYGSKNMGVIKPYSTLIFDVELKGIQELAKPYDVSGKDTITINEGLQVIKIVENPEGKQAESGKRVSVHYSGYFKNGKKFDSSVDKGTPIVFTLGIGQVIKGWDYGLAELKVGEKARLLISSEMAYGAKGRDNIPPNASLIFDVELLTVGD